MDACDLAYSFSSGTAEWLEDARRIRYQLRETTLTDLLLLDFAKLRDRRVKVKKSNESLTGADLDLLFVRRSGHEHFRLTLQAKILRYTSSNRNVWGYKHLAHRTRARGSQSATLVGHADEQRQAGEDIYPYYLFYNPSGVRPQLTDREDLADVGLTIVDGYVVADHITQHGGVRNLSSYARQFAVLEPMMTSFSHLICFAYQYGFDPTAVMREIIRLRTLAEATRTERAPDARRRRRVRPARLSPGERLPPGIRALLDQPAHSPEQPDDQPAQDVGRDTIVFISEEVRRS